MREKRNEQNKPEDRSEMEIVKFTIVSTNREVQG